MVILNAILAYLCEITSGKSRKVSLKDEYIYTRARIQHDHKYDSCGYIARFIFLIFNFFYYFLLKNFFQKKKKKKEI